jgi:hypothetical protein
MKEEHQEKIKTITLDIFDLILKKVKEDKQTLLLINPIFMSLVLYILSKLSNEMKTNDDQELFRKSILSTLDKTKKYNEERDIK